MPSGPVRKALSSRAFFVYIALTAQPAVRKRRNLRSPQSCRVQKNNTNMQSPRFSRRYAYGRSSTFMSGIGLSLVSLLVCLLVVEGVLRWQHHLNH